MTDETKRERTLAEYREAMAVDENASFYVVVPATPITVQVPPRRIRDLWSGTLHETGKCPTCLELLGNAHLLTCKWPGIVGSNKAEHYL